MRRFYKSVVDHPKLILTIFAISFAVAIACQFVMSVDYDLADYLPEGSPSTLALKTMKSEFGGGIPNARVMIKGVSIADALEYKEKLRRVDGVIDIMWLDDMADINVPLRAIDGATLNSYYRDNNALIWLTIDDEQRIEALKGIREIIGDQNALTGNTVATGVAITSTVTEIPLISLGGIAFAIFILTLTTTSYAEPFLILLGLGVAVIINAGSNIIFGNISFVTNAAGNVLQLAVSLDYSVFLLHRFQECRKEFSDEKEAMVEALCRSTSSILSSGLTTVIGFLALCLMKFKIGPDLGMALGKGVAFSLITVFIFMPVLLLTTYKLIDKTKHRSFLPSFDGFGRFVCRIMIPASIVFAIIVVPSFLASNSNNFYYGASYIFSEKTEYGADTLSVERVFGKNDTYVLMVPKGDIVAESELSKELHTVPGVNGIMSYVDTVGAEIPENFIDPKSLAKLSGENYSRMLLSVSANYEGENAFRLINKIKTVADNHYPGTWLLAGEGVSTLDLKETITADMLKVNLIAIGAVFLVLLLTTKSLSLPFILVFGIETAIWVNLSVPYFRDQTIFYMAYLIISSIQLGATVDYAILLTDRYMENRKIHDKKDSIRRTLSLVSASILTSASVLTVVGYLLGLLSSHGLIAQLGIFLGRGTICSLLVVMFVLPGMLYIFDGLIRKTTKGGFGIESK